MASLLSKSTTKSTIKSTTTKTCTILCTKKKTAKHSRLASSISTFWEHILTDGNHDTTKCHAILHISNRKKAEVLCYIGSQATINDIQTIGAIAQRKAKTWIGTTDNASIRILWTNDVRGSEKIFIAKGVLLASTADKKIIKEISQQRLEIDGIYDPKIQAVVSGIDYARYLTSLPANILNPETFVTDVSKRFQGYENCTIRVLHHDDLVREKMNLLLAVGLGSAISARCMIIEYNNLGEKTSDKKSNTKQKPVVLVGKGLTYDSGGYYAKPYPYMNTMHGDMAGGATVVGIIDAMAAQSAPGYIVGIIPLVENMIDAKAMKNGDIYTAKNGLTVCIDHSDAEGRLALADALCYAGEKYDASLTIGFATLTGSCVRALGEMYTGVFALDTNTSIDKLIAAGRETNDLMRRLPLDTQCIDAMKAKHADLSNIGSLDGMLGASTAAGFLSHFVKNPSQWIHCDIAGSALREKMKQPYDNAHGIGTGAMIHAVLKLLNAG